MRTIVIKDVEQTNLKLLDGIHHYIQLPERSTGLFSRQEAGEARPNNTQSTSMSGIPTFERPSQEQRSNGTLTVQIDAAHGNAYDSSSMENVAHRFYEAEGERLANEGAGKVLSGVHNDIDVEKIEQGCLRYLTKCRSLEALEALWSEYISGRLDKTIHSTIITPTLLSKIQAHYLTLDIYIPVQEYLLCKREIPLITGYDIIFNFLE
ncbi:uncharacterized protein [Ptychodera flava]|uniref:uncharacterized protein n=1 Tax=Ptychodera flava TaxID=63121 RepID=UPI00396A136F